MIQKINRRFRKAMGIFAIIALVQVAGYSYLMVKYSAWEMWPVIVLIALCGVYVWLRHRGWLELTP
ncbi:MAG: hypothetical protein IT328_04475 [Caldilineaceae bacterium]|nr:hypothetical protein [Caldilineaceae bacterium]